MIINIINVSASVCVCECVIVFVCIVPAYICSLFVRTLCSQWSNNLRSEQPAPLCPLGPVYIAAFFFLIAPLLDPIIVALLNSDSITWLSDSSPSLASLSVYLKNTCSSRRKHDQSRGRTRFHFFKHYPNNYVINKYEKYTKICDIFIYLYKIFMYVCKQFTFIILCLSVKLTLISNIFKTCSTSFYFAQVSLLLTIFFMLSQHVVSCLLWYYCLLLFYLFASQIILMRYRAGVRPL